MSGTKIISNQEFVVERKKNGCISSIEIQPIDKPNEIINPNVKENEDLNCCYGRRYGGSQQRRLEDENELQELLAICKGDKQRNVDTNRYNRLGHGNWVQYYSFPRLLLKSTTNKNHQDPFILQPSLFHNNHVPPTIYFNAKLSEDSRAPIGLPEKLQQFFKWRISGITPNSIRNCIAFMRFETFKNSDFVDPYYIGSWYKHMLTTEFCKLEEWRKVNHYPGSFHLGRKDKLWFRLKSANEKYGQDKFDNFHPTTFVLPRDYDDLRTYWENSPSKLFIIKPPASARGNGIKVINDISQIPETAIHPPPEISSKKSTMIVQQYISNPCLLENGQKFDLRVYVLLTSIDPLRIYVYEEGLVRFASTKYTTQEDGIIDQYMHLTNYYINKNNQEYQINNDCDSLYGCKWTLSRFWRYLSDHYTHIDVQSLWNKIIDIIIKTIVCCEGPMTRLSHQNCRNDYTSYELFGFDIILDENFKPWILEVNITPSLKSESDLDTSVKYEVIKDMFNVVGYNLTPIASSDLYCAGLGSLVGSRLFFDSRLYTECMTKRDKLKHARYHKLFKNDTEINKLSQKKPSYEHLNDLNIESTEQITSHESDGDNIMGGEQNLDQSINGPCNDDDLGCVNLINDSILNDLTQNDLRVLILSEDELSRCGRFKRVFPSATSSNYLKYFDKPRYYNLLLDTWERKYGDNRLDGIKFLSKAATFMN